MRIDLLMEALPVMGTGYLGIFIVTGVIIAVVSLLSKIGNKKKICNRSSNAAPVFLLRKRSNSLLHYSACGVIMSTATVHGGPTWSLSLLPHSFILATITFLITKGNSDLCCTSLYRGKREITRCTGSDPCSVTFLFRRCLL